MSMWSTCSGQATGLILFDRRKIFKYKNAIVISKYNSAYVDWKTSLSRFNIAGPKPGKGGGLC
jgi:hypothetical protein